MPPTQAEAARTLSSWKLSLAEAERVLRGRREPEAARLHGIVTLVQRRLDVHGMKFVLAGWAAGEVCGEHGALMVHRSIGEVTPVWAEVGRLNGEPGYRPAPRSEFAGARPIWEDVSPAPPAPLMIAGYTVSRRGDLIELTQATRPGFIPRSEGEEPRPTEIGETIRVERHEWKPLAAFLRGPVDTFQAQRSVDQWKEHVEATLDRILSEPPHRDTAAHLNLCRVALANLSQHEVAFARHGFGAADLLGMEWGLAGPIPTGILTRVSRPGDLLRVDSSLVYRRPPGDPAARPVALWLSPRPIWRAAPALGEWALGVRPLSGDLIMRREGHPDALVEREVVEKFVEVLTDA